MWMTAAPAASHSLAATASSSNVTGRAGAAALLASAPVGATVIRVLVMSRTLPRPGRPLSPSGARRHAQVLAGEGQRLGQIGDPVLPGGRPVGLHLDHYRA